MGDAVFRLGATGRLLDTVKGLLARGLSAAEVSKWTRVDVGFVRNISKEIKAVSKKPGAVNDEQGRGRKSST